MYELFGVFFQRACRLASATSRLPSLISWIAPFSVVASTWAGGACFSASAAVFGAFAASSSLLPPAGLADAGAGSSAVAGFSSTSDPEPAAATSVVASARPALPSIGSSAVLASAGGMPAVIPDGRTSPLPDGRTSPLPDERTSPLPTRSGWWSVPVPAPVSGMIAADPGVAGLPVFRNLTQNTAAPAPNKSAGNISEPRKPPRRLARPPRLDDAGGTMSSA